MVAPASQLDEFSGNQLRLVEAALAQFPWMQRNRYDYGVTLRPARFESTLSFRQHAAQGGGSRTHLLVFQEVDQLAQATVIASIRDRFDERGLRATAQTAAHLAARVIIQSIIQGIGSEHPLSTDRANAALDRTNVNQAGPAHRQAGNIDEGSTAKTTIGGEQGSEETFSNTAHGRDQR